MGKIVDPVPKEFTKPLPLRSAQQLVESVQDELPNYGTSSLAVYRTMSLGCGIVWALYLVLRLVSMQAATAHPLAYIVVTGFLVLAVATAATRAVDRRNVYKTMLFTCGASYSAVLWIHVIWQMATGDSPLVDAGLGDYGGIPCIMLATVVTSRWLLPYVMAAMTASVMTNYNLLDATLWQQITGALHSNLLLMPFMVFLFTGVATTRAADRIVARSVNLFLSSSQQTMLAQFRTNFMGYLHDEVLAHLSAISQKVKDPRDISSLATASARLEITQERLPLQQVLDSWEAAFHATSPHLEVRMPPRVPFSATIPATAANTLLEATMEALSNCRNHAPGAHHGVTVGASESDITVRIVDDGPGFDTSATSPGRAGVRIAIVGRMTALDGGRVTISSTPGAGTTVELGWSDTGTQLNGLSLAQVPTVQELTGIAKMLKPWCFVLFMVFVALVSAEFWASMNLPWFFAAVLAVCVSLGSHFVGRRYRLANAPAFTSAVASLVFVVCASFATRSSLPYWPMVWYPWVFTLLCCYLLMRGRGTVGWCTWILGVAWVAAAPLAGLVEFSPVTLLSQTPLLIAAWLMPKLAGKGAAQMSSSWQSSSLARVESATSRAQRAFATVTTEWVDAQLALATDPSLDDATIRHNTFLLERRLRDCIRCPLFDTPEVTETVWLARARGATVTLLDDRSTNPDSALHTRLTSSLITILNQLENGGELTARLYPAGRTTYASIVWKVNEQSEPQRLKI